MYKIAVKTLIMYFVVTIGMRLMGKRQAGQLSTTEIVVALMISEVASIPIVEEDIPIWNGVAPVLLLVGLEVLLSILNIKFPNLMKLTQGTPKVIIEKGIINEKALLKTRFSIYELNEELRLKNINLKEVYMAIVETNGQLSIIPKNEHSGVTRGDLFIEQTDDPIDFVLIVDGKVKENNLNFIGQNRTFLDRILKEKNIQNINEVLILCADSNGCTFMQKKK